MNITHDKRGPHNRHPHRHHLLTALLVAAMVMLLTVPAFATEAAGTNAPDTEVSTLAPNLTEPPADEANPTPAPTSDPVTTFEELQDAIAHANANDVIELGAYISTTPSELVLGRADCPVTIRRASNDACLILGSTLEGNIKVQNITFDGAELHASYPFVSSSSPMQIFENCNFVNCITEIGGTLSITVGEAFISDCHFSNNKGLSGAHLSVSGRKATIENCTFTDGYASDKGSVSLAPNEEAFLTGCTVSGNTAENRGGGVFVGSGRVIVARSKIYGNTTNGIADDITQTYWGRLFLVDDYDALVELYKPDGVIPNRWSVDNYISEAHMEERYYTDMVFSMTFADNEPSPPPVSYPTSVTLDKSELTLDVGETDTLTATLYPEGTNSSV